MKVRTFFVMIIFLLPLAWASSGCSIISPGSTKVVKPKNRKTFYNPHKHKRAKRTKKVSDKVVTISIGIAYFQSLI